MSVEISFDSCDNCNVAINKPTGIGNVRVYELFTPKAPASFHRLEKYS